MLTAKTISRSVQYNTYKTFLNNKVIFFKWETTYPVGYTLLPHHSITPSEIKVWKTLLLIQWLLLTRAAALVQANQAKAEVKECSPDPPHKCLLYFCFCVAQHTGKCEAKTLSIVFLIIWFNRTWCLCWIRVTLTCNITPVFLYHIISLFN